MHRSTNSVRTYQSRSSLSGLIWTEASLGKLKNLSALLVITFKIVILKLKQGINSVLLGKKGTSKEPEEYEHVLYCAQIFEYQGKACLTLQ